MLSWSDPLRGYRPTYPFNHLPSSFMLSWSDPLRGYRPTYPFNHLPSSFMLSWSDPLRGYRPAFPFLHYIYTMKALLFASRLALICNVCFLLCITIQRTHDFIDQKDINNIIILLGWLIAPFLNFFVNIWYAILLTRKPIERLPIWLWLFNLLILIVQIFIYFILPA
jgi:hypothetical protein